MPTVPELQCSRCSCGCWTWGMVSRAHSVQLVQQSNLCSRVRQTLEQEKTPGTWAIGPRTPPSISFTHAAFWKANQRISPTALLTLAVVSKVIWLVGRRRLLLCVRGRDLLSSLSVPLCPPVSPCNLLLSPALPGSHHPPSFVSPHSLSFTIHSIVSSFTWRLMQLSNCSSIVKANFPPFFELTVSSVSIRPLYQFKEIASVSGCHWCQPILSSSIWTVCLVVLVLLQVRVPELSIWNSSLTYL